MHWVLDALSAHEAPLLRYASTLVSPDDARDVVQDTFLALCSADRSAVDGRLVPWLFTVCKNRAISLRRKGRRRADLEEAMHLESAESGPQAALEQRQASASVLAILAELPERARDVVSLKFAAGLSYKEIAEVTGLSVSHVGVILHEAIGRLRERLAKQEATTVAFASGRS